jgi:hypothetical protein
MYIPTYLPISSTCSSVWRTELTVTGLSTYWTFPSSINISLAFRHTSLTIDSGIVSHLFSCSICLSGQLKLVGEGVVTDLSRSDDISLLWRIQFGRLSLVPLSLFLDFVSFRMLFLTPCDYLGFDAVVCRWI